jgi:hypothetical protein
MPLTQLSTLVLPAPLGPISANSSRASSASETPSILLDLAIASSLAALAAQIEFLDVRVAAQALGRAVEHDASIFHHVTVIGDVERHRCALLHEQNADAEPAADFGQPPQQILHQHGREAERKLVDQQEFGLADEAAGERQHLPFAAGKKAADAMAQAGELREELIGERLVPPAFHCRPRARKRRGEILGDGEIGKYLIALGHQHDPAPRVLVRRTILDALALEDDRALGDARVVDAEKAGDRPQCGGFAGAVRSQ